MIDTGLAGAVVAVTGADGGIGRAVAEAFAREGARIGLHFFSGRGELPDTSGIEHRIGSRVDAEATAERVRELGAEAVVVVETDLAAADAAPVLFNAIESRLGPVDVLVNNAAHCESPDGALTLTHAGLRRTYDVNVTAPALLTAELARRAAGTRDTVVVNISTDAARAFPGQIGYGTSKAALEAFTRAAAIDLGPSRVRVNTVAPGPVQTGWMSDDLVRGVEPSIPLRRVGTPGDIADAVVFLASAQARWITGQIVQVAGGHAL
ncbi:SDR family NAD(P)-dependent oxidoreductase [Streptomyces hygroscopicus]|uniref:SDR family NAD(P)-dependent oxidoreductase n=1 Tax=Streptomyces hygroscopicus TaxID=1912 RepID=UPI003674A635